LIRHYRFSSAWCFSRKDAIIDEYIVDYGEYAGLGSGSIGYLDGRCYANTFYIPEYIERLERGEIPLMAVRDFSLRDRIRYDFVMKLFGMELNLDSLREKYGAGTLLYLSTDILAFFIGGGLRYRKGRLCLTSRGRYYWVIMMREFFTAVNNFRDFCLNARGE
jgi:coproporphyrinogen III oxidase-like Fe-S oxidoreductase